MRTFSQSPHVWCQVYESTQYQGSIGKIQVRTNQYAQIPTFRFVPCPTLPNTVPTRITLDEIQRVATKQVF